MGLLTENSTVRERPCSQARLVADIHPPLQSPPSKLTYSGWFVQCGGLRAGSAHLVQATKSTVCFHHCVIAIELGVFPTLYVNRGFKLPLLTPKA